jgi:hypothetical protein
MSRRTPNVACGASQRNFIFVIFALGSFSTARFYYTHLPIPAKRFDVKRIESSRNLSAKAC